MDSAIELLAGVMRVVVMEHEARRIQVLKHCRLPLTRSRVVDLLTRDLAVFTVGEEALSLVELAPGVTVHEVRTRTEADFSVALEK